jgi:hypothetical protein
VRVKLNMPETTEVFRGRLRLLGAAVEFMKIRLPQSALWASSSEKLWSDHAEHILGPKALGRAMHDSAGAVSKTPSWQLVLHYEFEIRNKACEFMNRGHADNNNVPLDILAAMTKARLCPELRQDSFWKDSNCNHTAFRAPQQVQDHASSRRTINPARTNQLQRKSLRHSRQKVTAKTKPRSSKAKIRNTPNLRAKVNSRRCTRGNRYALRFTKTNAQVDAVGNTSANIVSRTTPTLTAKHD